MGWFGSKKVEEKESKEKNIELQNKSYNDNVNSNTPDNLIYQGPMSGMEEALNKFKETGEKNWRCEMMIKLKTLLREGLKDMVFGKTIKPRHKKRMDQKVTLFNENPKLTITPPPANDSQKTKSEIHYLLAYNDGVIDRKVVKEYDDIIKPFMSAVEKNGVQVSSDELTQIFMESSKFIIQLKYKFNRPRPYQIAEHYEIEDFKRHKLDTANSPSYPSGHAVQGRVIALYLSDKDPNNRKEYMMIGHNISESRIMARAHFPSDRKYGDMLGDELYKEMK